MSDNIWLFNFWIRYLIVSVSVGYSLSFHCLPVVVVIVVMIVVMIVVVIVVVVRFIEPRGVFVHL